MKPFILFSVFFTFLGSALHASDDLRLPDARSLAMGNDRATQSAFFNPSPIALLDQRSFTLLYSNKYGMRELATAGFFFSCPNRALPFGFHLSSFGFSRYRESMGRVCFGKRLFSFLAAGASIQYGALQSEIYENILQRLSSDIGLTFLPVDNVLIALLINDIPAFSFGDTSIENKDFESHSYCVGFQWTVINGLLITSACHVDEHRKTAVSLGMEYEAFPRFAFRAGLQSDPFVPSIGVGAGSSRFSFDTAALWHPQLGVNVALSVSFLF